MQESPTIEGMEIAVYRVPTDEPESDGTLCWDHTDAVVVQVVAGGMNGLGWTYAAPATAEIIADILRKVVIGQPAMAIEGAWAAMYRSLRNAGTAGAGSMAIAAVDIALWDLKAKLLGVSLVDLFGPVRDAVEIYGSGGFTSYSPERLCHQLAHWASEGITRVKMKVGRDAAADSDRVQAARIAIGPAIELFVDANGAYSRKQALAIARQFALCGVSWFEEPCSSNDLGGLRFLRDRGPARIDIAAGEYGDRTEYFLRMLQAGAVDCLQADVTRCGGYSGFLKVGSLCDAFEIPLSAHCAPQLHAHIGCAVSRLRHVEYFHDHTRIEQMLFDGTLAPIEGKLRPDRLRPGHGMELKTSDASAYRVGGVV